MSLSHIMSHVKVAYISNKTYVDLRQKVSFQNSEYNKIKKAPFQNTHRVINFINNFYSVRQYGINF